MKKLLFFLLLPLVTVSQIPDKIPNSYVHDYSSTLTSPIKTRILNDSIYAIEQRTGIQIAIVILPELPNGMEIEDFALELGRKWHVGNAKNGLVYVASIKEHKQRLEVSRELEGDIPDITAIEILREVRPYYKQNDYYGGLTELLSQIKNHVDPIAKEQLKLLEIEKGKKAAEEGAALLNIILFVVGLLSAGVCVWWFGFERKRRRREREEFERAETERLNDLLKRRTEIATAPAISSRIRSGNYFTPHTSIPPKRESPREEPAYIPPVTPDYSSPSPSRSSDNDRSSDYGNYGSSSSDSSSSDSGYSGGGATDSGSSNDSW